MFRRRPIVTRSNDWPPPPTPLIPMGGELRSARGILLGMAFGIAFWALLLLPAWLLGVL